MFSQLASRLFSYLPVPCICTIDFCHFIPLSPTLTVAGGHEVIFSHTFQLIRMKFDVAVKQTKLHILIPICVSFIDTRRKNCSFTGCIKKLFRERGGGLEHMDLYMYIYASKCHMRERELADTHGHTYALVE